MFSWFYKQGCTDSCNTNVHTVCLWKQPSRKIKTNIISSLKKLWKHCSPCVSQSCFVSFALLWHKWALKPADNTDHLAGRDKRSSFWEDWGLFSCLSCHWENTCSSGHWFLNPGVWRWPCCNHYMHHHGRKYKWDQHPHLWRKIVAIAKSIFFPISTCK